MENKTYKVWAVYETEKDKESVFYIIKHYVINTKTKQVQSAWAKSIDAYTTASTLNSAIRRQEMIEDSRSHD